MPPNNPLTSWSAVLFDLDGVLTPTAEVHRLAWAETFAPLFETAGVAPYTERDYFVHLDGKPRYDGVADLLASRGIELPWGTPSDGADQLTVCGIGNRKNEMFSRVLARDGVKPFPGSVRVLDDLQAAGVPIAVVSSSRNAEAVLQAARIRDRFPVVVDGVVAAAEGLAGKPDPATYLDAARKLGVPPQRAVVVEDAVAGVRAGVAGGFGLVVGVDRGISDEDLAAAGAHVVVGDLGELATEGAR
ncbi:MAG: beta-phosphoglucomutase family hydrolase [Microbacterium sp.]|nr:beta-phosphoglucomutase family hydrolase [Microbacterium sp.]